MASKATRKPSKAAKDEATAPPEAEVDTETDEAPEAPQGGDRNPMHGPTTADLNPAFR